MQTLLASIGNSKTCPVALIIRDNKILLGHRHYTLENGKTLSVWTCPGGRCDEGETLETTLKREVTEEIGINDLVIEEYLGEYPGTNKDDIVPVFLCSTNQEPTNVEPHKFSEWKWFSRENFPDTFINKVVAEQIRKVL